MLLCVSVLSYFFLFCPTFDIFPECMHLVTFSLFISIILSWNQGCSVLFLESCFSKKPRSYIPYWNLQMISRFDSLVHMCFWSWIYTLQKGISPEERLDTTDLYYTEDDLFACLCIFKGQILCMSCAAQTGLGNVFLEQLSTEIKKNEGRNVTSCDINV